MSACIRASHVDALNPNLAARLAARAARHPDRPAIVEYRGGRRRSISFGDLARRVAALAAGLAARGVSPGDRVLLFVPMSTDLYLLLIASLHLGATVVFVDAWADRSRLDRAVAATKPRAFIGVAKAHVLRLLSPAVRAIPLHLIVGGRWMSPRRLERPESATPAAPVAPATAALITFTTGSTGRMKSAARSHAFLWAQHEVLAEHLGLTEADVDMPTLPIFVLNNLASGTTSVLPDFDPRRPADIEPGTILHQMMAERVTTTIGSPAFYESLAGWCRGHGLRLPVRALFTGGAPVPPALARLLADGSVVAGIAHVVYGSTEAEPIASIEAREMLRAMAGDVAPPAGGVAAAAEGGRPVPTDGTAAEGARASPTGGPFAGGSAAEGARPSPTGGICAGFPVPQIALRLIRPFDGPVELAAGGWRDWEVAAGETGEVVVSGPHVLTGYWNDPAADRENKIREGGRVWHRTGDAARLDSRGRLWLMGRIGQRVQRAGRVWWSAPAELRALASPGVRHAAYFGLPDPGLGQRAVLCVEVAGGRLAPTARELLLAGMSPIPVDELHALEHIPRDPRHRSKTDVEGLVRALGG